MDFDSPDVEKDFPGLYASESNSGRKKDESDFSDADHDKTSKKDLLIGRRKDKKDKKDRGYATLEGESSPEEEPETKSPSKSIKKVKAFKFPSKSKEKREKSRDKEKIEVHPLKFAEKEQKEILDDKKTKKDKEKKEKDKKEKTKEKDKDKKDKKLKHGGSVASEEILDLGDVQPIFGVSLGLSVERSRCHDNINLPLVIRDCIDYLQEHGLTNDQIYKTDAVKSRLLQLKKLYNNRESTGTDDFDVPTACGLLKLFLKELPEPLLTTDLLPRFEEAAALPQVTEQQEELLSLIQQLPSYNCILISWLILHFDEVTMNEKLNKINAQNLAMLLSPSLQMSHRLLVALLCHCSCLFSDTLLFKYIPPITASSPNLPETSDEIIKELKKQDSLLTQIHSEMNAGFVSKKREEQLWEVQRIITQLKRKLRSFEKKQDSTQKSVDDAVDGDISAELTIRKNSDDESSAKTITVFSAESTDTKNTPQEISDDAQLQHQVPPLQQQQQTSQPASTRTNSSASSSAVPPDKDKIILSETGILLLHENHPEYFNLIRLQLENLELMQWKTNLQSRINFERTEIVRLKNLLPTDVQQQIHDHYFDTNLIYHNNHIDHELNNHDNHHFPHNDNDHHLHHHNHHQNNSIDDPNNPIEFDEERNNYNKIISHYIKENYLLEQKMNLLAKNIFDETSELIQLQVDLNLEKYRI